MCQHTACFHLQHFNCSITTHCHQPLCGSHNNPAAHGGALSADWWFSGWSRRSLIAAWAHKHTLDGNTVMTPFGGRLRLWSPFEIYGKVELYRQVILKRLHGIDRNTFCEEETIDQSDLVTLCLPFALCGTNFLFSLTHANHTLIICHSCHDSQTINTFWHLASSSRLNEHTRWPRTW